MRFEKPEPGLIVSRGADDEVTRNVWGERLGRAWELVPLVASSLLLGSSLARSHPWWSWGPCAVGVVTWWALLSWRWAKFSILAKRRARGRVMKDEGGGANV